MKELQSLKEELKELKNQNRVMSELEFKDRRWQDFSKKLDRILDWIEALGRPRPPPREYEGTEGARVTEEELEELGIPEEFIEEE